MIGSSSDDSDTVCMVKDRLNAKAPDRRGLSSASTSVEEVSLSDSMSPEEMER